MNSALYECTVMHRRIVPKAHRFVYRIFLFWIDLEELDVLAKRIPFFSVNRTNLYEFRDEDHFPGTPGTVCDRLEAFLRAAGEARIPDSVRVLTLPRVFGYVFNPVSIFFCFGVDGIAFAAVVEVENTFRERKAFLVPAGEANFHARLTKHFYVSPFSDLDLAFDFRLSTPDGRLNVRIDDYRGSVCELVSRLDGRRRELTARSLAWMTVKYPLVTLKMIAAIHWEAFRLWLKRTPFHRKEAHRDLQRDVLNPHKSLR